MPRAPARFQRVERNHRRSVNLLIRDAKSLFDTPRCPGCRHRIACRLGPGATDRPGGVRRTGRPVEAVRLIATAP